MKDSFHALDLDPKVLRALDRMGYKQATPIQAQTLPIILEGKDVLGLAETGSGKTAACAIPMCHSIDVERKGIQGLIIVPTRELALQYATETQKIGRDKGVSAFALFGGEDYDIQLAKMKKGVNILIATPGRLIDFIYSRYVDLSEVSILALDEADEMLSMGFYEDLEFVMGCLIQEHQTLLFSATMPESIRKLAQGHLRDPVEVALNREVTAPSAIDHHFQYCMHRDRQQKMVELIRKFEPGQGIIFCRSRKSCEVLAAALKKVMPGVDYLHAGLPQQMRTAITGKFRSQKIRLLIATDVAARGLDFASLTHVFMYELPPDPEVYVHRSGRTGRQGREGCCVSLVAKGEMRLFHRIMDLLGREPNWVGEPPSSKPPAPAGRAAKGSKLSKKGPPPKRGPRRRKSADTPKKDGAQKPAAKKEGTEKDRVKKASSGRRRRSTGTSTKKPPQTEAQG